MRLPFFFALPRFRYGYRLALFPPCHPERSRNPSKARIEWYEVPFGISVEKVRLAMLAQNDTAGVVSRKVGIPLRTTLGEGEKLAFDGNFTPPLILFPKVYIFCLSVLQILHKFLCGKRECILASISYADPSECRHIKLFCHDFIRYSTQYQLGKNSNSETSLNH